MIILKLVYTKRPIGGGQYESHINHFFYDDDVKAEVIENKISDFKKENKDYEPKFVSIERI